MVIGTLEYSKNTNSFSRVSICDGRNVYNAKSSNRHYGKRKILKLVPIEIKDLVVKANTNLDQNIEPNYTNLFQSVLEDYKDYQDHRNEIISSKSKLIFVKIAMIILAILILFQFGQSIPDNIKYVLFLSIGLFSMLIGSLDNHAIKKMEKLDNLKLQYENKLVCPKCYSTLINQSYTYWKGKKSCNNSKCDIKF